MASIKGDCPANLLETIRVQYNQLQADVNTLITKYNAVVTLANELKTALSAHVHGGVTTGAGNTGAASTISSASGSSASLTAEAVNRT
jgi:hypothetical protein